MKNPFFINNSKVVIENSIEYVVQYSSDIYLEQWRLKDTGKLSRELGPAITHDNGRKYWWYNGERIECSSQEEFAKKIKLKVFW